MFYMVVNFVSKIILLKCLFVTKASLLIVQK